MSTDRRIRASRDNGARSHGPTTPQGKRRSSQNGFRLRHGILARTVVLDDEDRRAFADLLSSLEDEFALVENMAIAPWRLMRIWGIEKESFTLEMAKTDTAAPPATRAARAFRTLSDESRSLENLHRYETRYDRQYARSYYLSANPGLQSHPHPRICHTNLVPFPNTPQLPHEIPKPEGPELRT